MKLHELDARKPTERIAKTLGAQLGSPVNFSRLGESRSRHMLTKVQGLLKEYRSSVSRHYSERNPDYMRLVMLEQALLQTLAEEMPSQSSAAATTASNIASTVTDPKAKAVMDKVKRGQALTPEEQKTMNTIALAKETKKPKRMVHEQSEIQQAQVVLAAQDMIDRVQKMMEEISEMQFKDLPALTNSIKNELGTEQASSFQASSAAALTELLASVQAGKTALESAQGVLTGQAPVVPGDTGMPAEPGVAGDMDMTAGDDLDGDLSLGANLDADEEDLDVPAASLGRERR
jgi:hypothetical protein